MVLDYDLQSTHTPHTTLSPVKQSLPHALRMPPVLVANERLASRSVAVVQTDNRRPAAPTTLPSGNNDATRRRRRDLV